MIAELAGTRNSEKKTQHRKFCASAKCPDKNTYIAMQNVICDIPLGRSFPACKLPSYLAAKPTLLFSMVH